MSHLLAAGRPSTAIGRYQIIRATMQTLQASKRLPGTALFTPELQDSMALSLMIGRGYSTWYTGRMSDADFAHRLSCEWASLPDPRAGGKSHYDGVGPNHAGTTLAHVYDALRRAKAAIGKSAPAAPQPAAPAVLTRLNTPAVAQPDPQPNPKTAPVRQPADNSVAEAEALNRAELGRNSV